MTDPQDNPTADPSTEPTGADPTPSAVEPNPTDSAALTADRDKWKTLARKHEKDAKARAKELEDLRTENLSDAEKAIETARTEGRTAALAEVGSRLAGAELRAQAATAGVDLPDLTYVNLATFLTEAGEVDSAAVAKFVKSLNKAATEPTEPAFAQDLGLGRQNAAGPVMDPQKLAAMVAEVSPF
ncbi:hypothetical protein [Yinghuangia sp. YIM S09857]|uniref:hypothetical protein n=1 Tax=Yinghuangia sp. YIM S09857 TaxID=3436929 RepID=UPI003F532DE2